MFVAERPGSKPATRTEALLSGNLSDRVQRFFERYEEGANTFAEAVILEGLAHSFMGADPNGAQVFEVNDEFRKAIPRRRQFFQSIGFLSAHILGVEQSQISADYILAKVRWEMIFEKDGRAHDVRFVITYVLHDAGGADLKVVFYVSHDDEQKAMREAGLIPLEPSGG